MQFVAFRRRFIGNRSVCALHLKQHAHDPEEAIVRAVNDTHNNDTIAAIVGAAAGALHSKDALPKRWIENHSGRTRESDDGKIFELLKQAKEIFWK